MEDGTRTGIVGSSSQRPGVVPMKRTSLGPPRKPLPKPEDVEEPDSSDPPPPIVPLVPQQPPSATK